MKLLRLSLLVLFSFAAGLVVYRMASKPLPSLRLEWPNTAYSVELTADQTAPDPYAPPAPLSINETSVAAPQPEDIVLSNVTAFDIKVADSSASIGLLEPIEPQLADSESAVDVTALPTISAEPATTITATADGGRVHLQREDGFSIEADQIVIGQSADQVVGRPDTRATASDGPLPTISPSDDGTIYVLEQNATYSVTMGQPVLLECASLRIVSVSGFDPKVVRMTAESPHVLRVFGVNPGRTALKVVLDKQGEATLYATINVAPSPITADPEVHVGVADGIGPADPLAAEVAASDDKPLPIDTFDVGVPGSAQPDKFDEPSPEPVDRTAGTVAESGNEPGPTTDEPPAEPHSDFRSLRGFKGLDELQPLPEIEPSESGTVVGITQDSQLSLAAGGSLVVEEEHGGRFARVSGFDPKIIRVTARSAHRLLIEGLAEGFTSLKIIVPEIYNQALRVEVRVGPRDKTAATLENDAELVPLELTERSKNQLSLLLNPTPPPQVKPADVGTVYHFPGQSEYTIAKGKSIRFELVAPITSVDDFDPQVIGVVAENSQRLKVTALEAGTTALRIIGTDSDDAASIQIRVTPWESSHDELVGVLRELYPAADIKLVAIRDSILLRGTVSTLAEAKQITEIAEQFAPKVINQLRVNEDSAASRKHIVTLKFADAGKVRGADKIRTLAVGDRVNLIRGREVRDGNAVEFEEAIIARDAEVTQVHISGSFGLLGVRVTPLEAHVLSETDSRELTVVRKNGSDSDPDGFPTRSSPSPRSHIEIPPGMRIAVVKNLKAEVVRSLTPRQRVDIQQRIVVRRVIKEIVDGVTVAREVAEALVRQLAAGVEVVAVDRDAGSVDLVVTAEVAETLANASVEDLTLHPSGESGLPYAQPNDAPPTYTPGDAPQTYTPGEQPTDTPAEPGTYAPTVTQTYSPANSESDSADQPAQSITLGRECIVAVNPAGKLDLNGCAKCHADAARPSTTVDAAADPLHSDIRALHDDVRKLLALLEQRLSQGSHDEHEFSLPAKTFSPEEKTFAPETKTYSADEVPSESKPQPSEEPGGKTAPGADAAPRSESDPDALPEKSSGDADVTTESDAPPQPSDKSPDIASAADLDRVWHLIGLKFTPLSAGAPQIQNHFVNGGLLVDEVRPKSPLAEAEIQPGDVIVGIDHWETTDFDDLRACLRIMTRERVPNTSLYIIRNDEQKVPELKFRWLNLESPPRPDTSSNTTLTAPPPGPELQEQIWQRIGMRVSQLKSDASQLQGHPYQGGLLIDAVRPDSPADKAGLRVGDVLVGLHVWETVSPENLRYVLNHPRAIENRPVKFYVLRNGEVLYGRVDFDGQSQSGSVDAQHAPREISQQTTQTPPLQTVDAELVGVR